MTLVSDIQYFSPYIFYIKLSECTNGIFDQYEGYQKMSFRNRCSLSGANGIINLSVPLLNGRDQRSIMKEVKIANRDDWQSRHWKTIMSCYNRSPWFEYYRDELDLLFRKKFDFLIDWNLACFYWVAAKLSISDKMSLITEWVSEYPQPDFLDWRSHLKPSTINLLHPETGRYPQVFEEKLGFIPNLSVLDRLFCEGNKWL